MYAQRSDHICIVKSLMDPEKHTIERFQMEERSLHHSSIGKGKVVKEGKQVAILNFGGRLEECKKAAEILSKKGIIML